MALVLLTSCATGTTGPALPDRGRCRGPGLEVFGPVGEIEVAVGDASRRCSITRRERHCALGCWYGGSGLYRVRVGSRAGTAQAEVVLDGSEVQLEGAFFVRADGASLEIERWLPSAPGIDLAATTPASERWQSLALVNRSAEPVSFVTLNGALIGVLVRLEDDGTWTRISHAPGGSCGNEWTGRVIVAPGDWREVRTMAEWLVPPLMPGRYAHVVPYVAADRSTRVVLGDFVIE